MPIRRPDNADNHREIPNITRLGKNRILAGLILAGSLSFFEESCTLQDTSGPSPDPLQEKPIIIVPDDMPKIRKEAPPEREPQDGMPKIKRENQSPKQEPQDEPNQRMHACRDDSKYV